MLRRFILMAAALGLPAYAENLDLSRLQLPPGFHIRVFADAGDPRMLVFSPGGTLVVTEPGSGAVTAFPDPKHTGRAERTVRVVGGLNEPHGLAFRNGKLYVAENDKVRRFDWDEASLHASNGQVIAQLPGSGGHSTRTLVFWRGKMYVSAGSSCNVCIEKDSRRATVMEFNEDGSGMKIFAHGLRNSVGLAVNAKSDTLWGTDNGRDWLGDNAPPDKINDLTQGGDFGWPYCYGRQIPDPSFTKPGDERCKSTVPPKVELQAHSAPLGLAFASGTMFPAEYRTDLFVALHGSWNRSVPTGYKVIRVRMNDKGEPAGVEDFITGWLRPGETRKGASMGRPAGIVFAADGSMYVSDDAGGTIYRVTWEK